MAFKITRVGHLVLKVKDLERSRKFFTEVLGFPQVGDNDRGMIFFSIDVKDNHHMLALREAKPGAAMPDLEQVGMEHVSFEVATFAELQEVYRKFKQHDVKLRHTVFHGVAKSIYFYDPDGNVSKSIATCRRRSIARRSRTPITATAPSTTSSTAKCHRSQAPSRRIFGRIPDFSPSRLRPREFALACPTAHDPRHNHACAAKISASRLIFALLR